jgi:hypothetical protein
MNENEMDYRGSKSDIIQIPQPIEFSVKEQRVDGSWLLNKIAEPKIFRSLRCTLMDFERNYLVKIPSKQLNKNNKNFSTIISSLPVNAWFITGLIDAEGSFSVVIDKNKYRKLG